MKLSSLFAILSERSESRDLSRAQHQLEAGGSLCNPEILRLRATPSAQDDTQNGGRLPQPQPTCSSAMHCRLLVELATLTATLAHQLEA